MGHRTAASGSSSRLVASPSAVDPRVGLAGLTSDEADARTQRGLVNDVPAVPTRTFAQIVRANVFTRFNALLGGLLIVVLVVGDVRDALFGLVLVANTAIGVIQELRAKWTLDRLLVVTTPHARVVRDGRRRDLPAAAVVQDDVIDLRPGDQVVVDGDVVASEGLEVDETLLTGESDPVAKSAGDGLLSGSFVAAGSGAYRATRVGADAYASRVTAEARRFTLFNSRLRADIDTILRLVSWVLVPTAVVLVISQLRANTTAEAAIAASVGGVVAMVPEGLVLLTSTAFAVAVVRLARHRTLVQELASVEGLARADVLCLDKTGTLTQGAITFEHIDVVGDASPGRIETAVGAMAAADPNPNATLRALAARFPAPADWSAARTVPFSSARKYAAATFGGHGEWVLGAPEILLAHAADGAGTADRVRAHVEDGRRVLLLADVEPGAPLAPLPAHLRPQAVIVLSDQLRPDAASVLGDLAREDVTVKVISGDDPRVVSALARRAGLGEVSAIDARRLPDEPDALASAVERTTIFGRVTPQRKDAIVAALQSAGHVVAMIGDGVNDVLALKRADIGVAMGSGSPAARGVAQLVLLDDEFSALPRALAEGRRVIGNIERVARLFVTKSVYSFVLALAIGAAVLPFPFLPRHLSLVGALTIGIPGTVLAMAPNRRRPAGGLIAPVLRFAVPAGLLAAGATFAGYAIARPVPGVNLDQARTTATVVLLAVGLLVLVRLAQPLDLAERLLIATMAAAMLLALTVPAARTFFALEPPPPVVILAGVGIVAIVERLLRADVVFGGRR